MNYLELRAVCVSKKFYDTEFEATIAAAHTEKDVHNPMEPYKCPFGKHWHVRNVNKDLRGKHDHQYIVCKSCQSIVKRARFRKHMKRHGQAKGLE